MVYLQLDMTVNVNKLMKTIKPFGAFLFDLIYYREIMKVGISINQNVRLA